MENTLNGTTPLYGSGDALGLFEGISPAATDILIKYTYYGDTNLNGEVDGTDFSRVDTAYAADLTTPGQFTGWFNGDFNYDGYINGSDYTLMDNAFNQQGTQITAQVASETALVAGTPAVPEPTALGLLGAGAIGLLGRSRRAAR
jgi:hypothetical protein